jgi:CBS domain-containing protein
VEKLSKWLFNLSSGFTIMPLMKTIQHIIQGKPVHCVDKEETVQRACERMAEHQIGALVVLDDEQVVGIFTERDLLTRVVAQGLQAHETRAGDVMSHELITASPTETYATCLEKMQRAHCRHLPVVSDGRLMGIISLRDLLQVELDEKREEVQFLQAYISHPV